MPRYYCDYCDTYLTHDSPSVRKQHNAGYKHKANVRSYYQQFEEQQTQSLIDQRIKEHLGQTAAFQQVGAVYNQHLASLPRPGMPILPTPAMPALHSPLAPGIRPPILPRPVAGVPGYSTAPMMQPIVAPPGAPIPMQVNGLPRPPVLNPQTATPGGTGTPSSNGAPTMSAPALYQPTSAALTSGGFDTFNINASSGLQMPAPSGTAVPPTSAGSQDGFSYAQAPETNP